MSIAREEFKELIRIQENVRRHANTLELCSYCQRISECQHSVGDGGTPVWLCNDCWEKIPFSLPPSRPRNKEYPWGNSIGAV
jgi:hypothetical protein